MMNENNRTEPGRLYSDELSEGADRHVLVLSAASVMLCATEQNVNVM